MKIRSVTVLLFIFTLFLSSFAESRRRRRFGRFDCEKQVERAGEKFEKGRYADAALIYDEIRYQCSGNSMIDTVLYYLGMSYLRSRRPIDAQTEFERLMQNFPNSEFAQESQFRLGQSMYLQSNSFDRDQTETLDARRILSEFVETYPASFFRDSAEAYIAKCQDKLAHKEFSHGRFYQKKREYEAAIIYYNSLMAEYPESEYVPQAKLNLAQALMTLNRETEALAIITDILEQNYSSDVTRKAQLMRSRIGTAN